MVGGALAARVRRGAVLAACGCVLVGLTVVVGAPAGADVVGPIDFESYTTGTVNGQDGWSSLGAAGSGCALYDHAVADNSLLPFGAPAGFGAQSLRVSNSVTSGCFGDQTFANKVTDEAGETGADGGAYASGTRLPRFVGSFDLASVTPGTEQTNLRMSVSPDRGDGARMSYLRFEDTAAGWNIYFDDYLDVAPLGSDGDLADGCGVGDNFTDTLIATGLSTATEHDIEFDMTLVDGPHNDVVTISIDGSAVHTGTSWEDYFRYCAESGGGPGGPLADKSRTVRTLLFRTSGTAEPANAGKGFLVDGVQVASEPDITPPSGTVSINAAAATTASAGVSLGLSATDVLGVTAYRVGNGGDCSAESWVPVTSTTSYSASVGHLLISGQGTKTVCAQFKDAAGNVSTDATDAIDLLGVDQVVSGDSHSCGLLSDSTVRCWGENGNGQLGDGTTTDRLQPVVVKNVAGTVPLSAVTQITAGKNHTCARLSSGAARCWGDNISGQLGDGTTTDRSLPVVVQNVAGTGPLTPVTQMSAGGLHTCARLSLGSARCWGNNGSGRLGDGTVTNRHLPVVVLNPAGTAAITGVVQIAAGGQHTCAALSTANGNCWGANANGQLGDGTTTSRVLPVAVKNTAGSAALASVSEVTAGTIHSCARLTVGSARCWGNNGSGRLGDGTVTNRLLPVVVLNTSGIGALGGIAHVSAGSAQTCATLTSGGADCWGSNGSGRLGDGTIVSHPLAVAVQNSGGSGALPGAVGLSTGGAHTCVQLADDTAACFGANASGQVGDGTSLARLLIVSVLM